MADGGMTDQAIVALTLSTGGAIASLVYYLTGSIKSTLDKAISEILEKLDEFVDALSQVREKVAERTVAMIYIEKELDQIKKNCRHCLKQRDKEI